LTFEQPGRVAPAFFICISSPLKITIMQVFFFIGSIAKKGNYPFIVFAKNIEDATALADDVLEGKGFGQPDKLTVEAAKMIAEINCKGKFQSY
jgi:hypothetical protein